MPQYENAMLPLARSAVRPHFSAACTQPSARSFPMSWRVASAWISFSANSSVPNFSQGSADGTFEPGPPMTFSSWSSSSQWRPVWNTKELRP